MKLVADTSHGAYAISVKCIEPRHSSKLPRSFTLANGYSDIEGEPFKAYYCAWCAHQFHAESLPTKVQQAKIGRVRYRR